MKYLRASVPWCLCVPIIIYSYGNNTLLSLKREGAYAIEAGFLIEDFSKEGIGLVLDHEGTEAQRHKEYRNYS